MKKINHLILIGIALVLMVNVSFGQTPSDSWRTDGNWTTGVCSTTILGTKDKCSLRFFTDYKFRSVITETGEFGFGIEYPQSMFHIHQPNSSNYDVWGRDQAVEVGFRKDSTNNRRGGAVMVESMSNSMSESDDASTILSSNRPFVGGWKPIFSGYSEASILLTNAITGSTANDGLKIKIYNTDATFHLQESGDMLFKNNTTTSFQLNSNGDFYIEKGANYPFYYKASSNRIGIGTKSPDALFHVNGDSYFGGTIRIGTTKTSFNGITHKVAIKGTIISDDFYVENTASWPDYVFEENYEKMPLKDLKNFVQEHKHLPEVQTASEVEQNGIQLGEMNKILLKKLEEAYLYLFELEKRIAELEKTKGEE